VMRARLGMDMSEIIKRNSALNVTRNAR
jgi:hypothetical protein